MSDGILLPYLVIRQLLRERYDSFQKYYKNEQRIEIARETYTISDYLLGINWISASNQRRASEHRQFLALLESQIAILGSSIDRLDSLLASITGVLQVQLFDDEISVAAHLSDTGHLRAAGAVAGVVLEGHLKQVATNHAIIVVKKDPSIGDWNDALKSVGIIGVPNWRYIQHLGDLRKPCDHKKAQEPTKDEVDDLIRGTDRIIKTIF